MVAPAPGCRLRGRRKVQESCRTTAVTPAHQQVQEMHKKRERQAILHSEGQETSLEDNDLPIGKRSRLAMADQSQTGMPTDTTEGKAVCRGNAEIREAKKSLINIHSKERSKSLAVTEYVSDIYAWYRKAEVSGLKIMKSTKGGRRATNAITEKTLQCTLFHEGCL